MTPVPPPAGGPKPPDNEAPLSLEHTPAYGIATNEYVKRKLEATEKRLAEVAAQAGRNAASHGTPIIPKALAPWLLAGFLLCGAVTSAAVTYPDDIPRGIMVAATVGSLFFGGLLGASSGLRR